LNITIDNRETSQKNDDSDVTDFVYLEGPESDLSLSLSLSLFLSLSLSLSLYLSIFVIEGTPASRPEERNGEPRAVLFLPAGGGGAAIPD